MFADTFKGIKTYIIFPMCPRFYSCVFLKCASIFNINTVPDINLVIMLRVDILHSFRFKIPQNILRQSKSLRRKRVCFKYTLFETRQCVKTQKCHTILRYFPCVIVAYIRYCCNLFTCSLPSQFF